MLIGTGVNAIGGVLGGGGGEAKQGNLHLVNPAQQYLYNQMLAGLKGGGGDFGFGTSVKQGGSQLAQMMASRGISPQSGAYAGAYGNMVGQAAGQDQDARRQYMMQLLGMPLQTAQTAGANLIPGSPSQGWSPGAQEGSWNSWQQRGWLAPTTGGFRHGAPDYPGDPAKGYGAPATGYGANTAPRGSGYYRART
jgi:hypothetical protein